MAHLLLHIGAHKTGTTYVQRTLFRNRARLAEAGVFYPDLGPNPAHHVLTAKWIPDPAFARCLAGAGGIDALWHRVVTGYADREGTLILSGEPFSRLAPARVDFAELAEMVRPFASVRLVYVVRDQVGLIQSVWQQVVKSGRMPNLANFVDHAIAEGLASGVPVDHGLVLDQVTRGFAPERITFLDYRSARRHPGGVLAAILAAAGLDGLCDGLEAPPPGDRNSSPPPLAHALAARIARPGPATPRLIDTVERVLADHFGARPRSALTLSQIAAIREGFAGRNAALAQRIRAVQPDFALSPDPVETEELVTPHHVAAPVALDIARALYRAKPPPVR
ncbi:hypothetical protein [Celeribacter indicus]|uniref:Sulfotransferase domain-containing protein n=1 Tax=Celeribacter indicus TaxID=1208324 RepID=A0A0B5DVF3_9RHOB|nr:hypothetical protein [Celeribacter indicus]AJE44726.1 hypothetical protein P73_0011 [Celeribacter indicus]SDX60413.1 hypothetical protein SAMN05443573_1513 [Celeribacter indicus]